MGNRRSVKKGTSTPSSRLNGMSGANGGVSSSALMCASPEEETRA